MNWIKPGKVSKEWLKTRRAWLKANPPNFEGYYECYLCHKWVPAEDITLDHVISRTRAPGRRQDISNLEPCCSKCNSDKGSK